MILDLDEIKAFQSNATKRARVCKCARKKGGRGGVKYQLDIHKGHLDCDNSDTSQTVNTKTKYHPFQ